MLSSYWYIHHTYQHNVPNVLQILAVSIHCLSRLYFIYLSHSSLSALLTVLSSESSPKSNKLFGFRVGRVHFSFETIISQTLIDGKSQTKSLFVNQSTFTTKIERIDQVTEFHRKFIEGYFCINTAQPVHFAVKSSAIDSSFQKSAIGRDL